MIINLLQAAGAAAVPVRPLIPWGRAAFEYAGFLAWFGTYGAIGYRYFVLGPLERSLAARGEADAATLRAVHDASLRGAAKIGLVGALLFVVGLVNGLLGVAQRRHLALLDALAQQKVAFWVQVALIAILVLFFLLAMARMRGAWAVAAVAGVCLAFRTIVSGRWTTLVNPVHELSASLWIGTLAVMVIVGLSTIASGAVPRDRRGPITAELVTRFSPLALVAASLLVISGVTTAWLHLHVLSNLWSTPYGITLILKLCVVLMVVGLGAWNWRGMTPRLGQESAAHGLRRSASSELAVAAIVLALTAVLVSIPSPRAAKGPGRAPTPSASSSGAPSAAQVPAAQSPAAPRTP